MKKQSLLILTALCCFGLTGIGSCQVSANQIESLPANYTQNNTYNTYSLMDTSKVTAAINMHRKEMGTWTIPDYTQGNVEYFASPGYYSRAYGSDWVLVQIKHMGPDKIRIHVSSRRDIKKQTCYLNQLDAHKVGPNLYKGMLFDTPIFVKYTRMGIELLPGNEDARLAMFQPCSGGGSLINSYTRVNLNNSQN